MLISDDHVWDQDSFEAHVEGMCEELQNFPYARVAFVAHTAPEVIFLFFAAWKMGKIVCPLSYRLPSLQQALEQLQTKLFTPQMPTPKRPKPWNLAKSRTATMLFTSGSSGMPKIAALSLANHLYSALGFLQMSPLDPCDRWHLSLPLFHIAGISILVRCYLAKASILLSQQIKTATHLSLVPTQLLRLVEEKHSLPALKMILLGGAPLPSILSPWPVFESYGMTEASSLIALDGIVAPQGEVKLADGEICVRGKTLFQGYFEKEELFLPVDKEGWFATKDLGLFDERHKLKIIGRKDNLFISGGENIQPEEIERRILALPGIEEAVVVPLPDKVFGRRPAAFLAGADYSLRQLQEGLKESLPRFKWPVRVFPLPPKKGLKHNRLELKALAEFLNR